MKLICIAAMAFLFHSCHRKISAQTIPVNQLQFTDLGGNPMLLGIHTKEDLQQPPFQGWYNKNYADYTIDSLTADQLKPFIKDKTFEIFMGTWCGDSKREVPRLFKILAYAGVPPAAIKMIMVDDHDSTYKQSPLHEEQGKGIHHVPDLIVYNNNKEMNRIIESPVISLEKDLLAVVKAETYQPHYHGAAYLLKHTSEKTIDVILKDSIQVVASLKGLVKSSAEINTLGYMWMAAGETGKAMLAFQLNAMLFPEVANVYDSLGDINTRLNNKDAARKYYMKATELQPGAKRAPKEPLQRN